MGRGRAAGAPPCFAQPLSELYLSCPQPRLRLPRLHLCVPQLRLCSQPRNNETCLPRLFRLAQRCSPASLLDLHSHTRSSVSLTRSRSFGCRSLTLGRSLTSVRSTASVSRNVRYMSASTSVRSPASAVPGKPWHRGPVPVTVTPRRAGSALSSGSVEHHLCRGMR